MIHLPPKIAGVCYLARITAKLGLQNATVSRDAPAMFEGHVNLDGALPETLC